MIGFAIFSVTGGKWVDAFVPKRTREGKNYRFGFVRFRSLEEAKEAEKSNGVYLLERKLLVKLAQYGREDRKGNRREEWETRRGKESVVQKVGSRDSCKGKGEIRKVANDDEGVVEKNNQSNGKRVVFGSSSMNGASFADVIRGRVVLRV